MAGALLLGCERLFPAPDIALPISGLDLESRPVQLEPPMPDAAGPFFQVASGEVRGEDFTLVVYRAPEGVCLSLDAHQYRGGGYGAAPGDGPAELGAFGMIAESGLAEGTVEIDGLVHPDAAAVWVVTDDGQRANALVISEAIDNVEASVFLVFMPAGTVPAAIVAADSSGQVLDELPLVSIAPGGPGAPPTPAD